MISAEYTVECTGRGEEKYQTDVGRQRTTVRLLRQRHCSDGGLYGTSIVRKAFIGFRTTNTPC